MFFVTYSIEFPAAHYLPEYDGKCANVHGHNYRAQVEIKGSTQNENGMLVRDGVVIDFRNIKLALKRVIPDHKVLNEWFENDTPPSTENVARELFWRLRAVGLPLTALTLHETDHSAVRYEPNGDEPNISREI